MVLGLLGRYIEFMNLFFLIQKAWNFRSLAQIIFTYYISKFPLLTVLNKLLTIFPLLIKPRVIHSFCTKEVDLSDINKLKSKRIFW